ncbi:hypothetical protein [Streptomyces aidingensis]|uniref:Uncharacterized protein n=1 Tax=Streptomyces aidingensis TaxID=910347 RepID=A0A1I1QAA2_9ACTN|nr:hypothetical protein [Streptomyces aidingensis]SFD15060.1 hypothetical protein SAMN05421773_110164 [Streptomyces aidingensis]
MVRKKVEGDEDQRRAAAHAAEKAGEQPSSRGETTGASKQRTHRPHRSTLTHEEKTASVHRGKQRSERESSWGTRPSTAGGRSFTGRGTPEYGPDHERVFQALAAAEDQHGGEGVYLPEVARLAGLPLEQVRALMHDLVTVHGLATELQGADRPDLGPRYESKARR